MKRVALALPSLCLALLVASCGGSSEPLDPTPGETRVVYSCEGGGEFTAVFSAGTEYVVLEIGGDQLELPQIPSASGVAYSDGGVTFHAEEAEAFIVGWPGGVYENCTGTNT